MKLNEVRRVLNEAKRLYNETQAPINYADLETFATANNLEQCLYELSNATLSDCLDNNRITIYPVISKKKDGTVFIPWHVNKFFPDTTVDNLLKCLINHQRDIVLNDNEEYQSLLKTFRDIKKKLELIEEEAQFKVTADMLSED